MPCDSFFFHRMPVCVFAPVFRRRRRFYPGRKRSLTQRRSRSEEEATVIDVIFGCESSSLSRTSISLPTCVFPRYSSVQCLCTSTAAATRKRKGRLGGHERVFKVPFLFLQRIRCAIPTVIYGNLWNCERDSNQTMHMRELYVPLFFPVLF